MKKPYISRIKRRIRNDLGWTLLCFTGDESYLYINLKKFISKYNFEYVQGKFPKAKFIKIAEEKGLESGLVLASRYIVNKHEDSKKPKKLPKDSLLQSIEDKKKSKAKNKKKRLLII